MKQRLSWILSLLMLLCILQAFPRAQAAQTVASGNCGETMTWTLDEEGTLTISGTGWMTNETSSVNVPWYQYKSQIKSVVVEEGVLSIGSSMLALMTEPFTIQLPSSLRYIQDAAFQLSTGLTDIALPETLERIGARAFQGTSLQSMDIPDGIEVQTSVFLDCLQLKKATVGAGVYIDGYLFQNCAALEDVTLEEGLEIVGGVMFDNCTALKSITIPGSVKIIGRSAFRGCTALSEVTLEEGVEEIQEKAFENCTALKSITIPSTVNYMGNYIFTMCENLEDIYFMGGAPEYESWPLAMVRATCHYPMGADSWTLDVRKDFSAGPAKWVAYTHVCQYTKRTIAPTCTETGYTYLGCSCGNFKDKKPAERPLGHSFYFDSCIRCGAQGTEVVTDTALRLAGDHRYATALLVADQTRLYLAVDKLDTVVVASGTEFADALSGSYLAAVKNAPILLASGVDWVDNQVKEFINLNLKPGGTVYILGGTKAIPAAFAEGLADFQVKRLAGDNRFLTNLMILQEAGVGDKSILICTGDGFADSLSASAAKQPILLVYGTELLPEQEAFLASVQGNPMYIIGGTGAVSAELEARIAAYGEPLRLAGDDRFQTSVLIAEAFFDHPQAAIVAYAADFPDGLCGGSLAAALDAPLILTMKGYEQSAAGYVQDNPIGNTYVLGGTKLIPDASVKYILQTP